MILFSLIYVTLKIDYNFNMTESHSSCYYEDDTEGSLIEDAFQLKSPPCSLGEIVNASDGSLLLDSINAYLKDS